MSDELKNIAPPVQAYEPKRNAVIIEYIAHQGDNGTVRYQPVVSIECKDQNMLTMLQRVAWRLQN